MPRVEKTRRNLVRGWLLRNGQNRYIIFASVTLLSDKWFLKDVAIQKKVSRRRGNERIYFTQFDAT